RSDGAVRGHYQLGVVLVEIAQQSPGQLRRQRSGLHWIGEDQPRRRIAPGIEIESGFVAPLIKFFTRRKKIVDLGSQLFALNKYPAILLRRPGLGARQIAWHF